MAEKVMIATLYSYQPVITGVIKLGASTLYLIVDKVPDKKQEGAIEQVKQHLKDIVKIHLVHTSVYDIYQIAAKCVQIIDKADKAAQITLNVSGARKTKAFALIYAGYVRFHRVSEIVYITKEQGEIIQLPLLKLELNEYEIKMLNCLNNEDAISVYDIISKIGGSRAKAYRSIKDMRKKGLVSKSSYKLKVAGKIALL